MSFQFLRFEELQKNLYYTVKSVLKENNAEKDIKKLEKRINHLRLLEYVKVRLLALTLSDAESSLILTGAILYVKWLIGKEYSYPSFWSPCHSVLYRETDQTIGVQKGRNLLDEVSKLEAFSAFQRFIMSRKIMAEFDPRECTRIPYYYAFPAELFNDIKEHPFRFTDKQILDDLQVIISSVGQQLTLRA